MATSSTSSSQSSAGANGVAEPGLVVEQFRDFEALFTRIQNQLVRGRTTAAVARGTLIGLFETQGAAAQRQSTQYFQDIYRPAELLMAAMVDESLGYQLGTTPTEGQRGTSQWTDADRTAWRENPLVTELFGADVDAGTEVFADIDTQLSLVHQSASQIALAQVQLMGLGLGYQGKYRNADSTESLTDTRFQLYDLIYPQAPRPPDVGMPLFPDAYRRNSGSGVDQTLPALRPWLLAICAGIVLVVLVSFFVWRDATQALRPALAAVKLLVDGTPDQSGANGAGRPTVAPGSRDPASNDPPTSDPSTGPASSDRGSTDPSSDPATGAAIDPGTDPASDPAIDPADRV